MKKLAILFLMLIFTLPVLAQHEHETSSDVPELTEFHQVIYQLWHTAWPEKNIPMLKSLLPDIQEGMEKINKVELTGILRDKKPKWEEVLKKLNDCVDAFKSAIEKDNAKEILDEAEKLHSLYEGLVRVVKPMVKEVDAFHQVLYMLFHYYAPEYNLEKIKESAAEMKNKMTDVMKAQLSKRLESRIEKFNSARSELDKAVNELNESIETNNKDQIIKAVDKVHDKYQELEKVFD
ncbi:MAG: hypothetical protein AB1432_08615 [Bacteroidota bacterium]|jgi:DNA repair exonuclease SbcCD ATPase subunit